MTILTTALGLGFDSELRCKADLLLVRHGHLARFQHVSTLGSPISSLKIMTLPGRTRILLRLPSGTSN